MAKMSYNLYPRESESVFARFLYCSLHLKRIVFQDHFSLMYVCLHSNVDSSNEFELLNSDNNTNLNF